MKDLKPEFLHLLLVLICIGICTSSFSQSSLFSYENYENESGESLQYRQLVSDYALSSKYPLVIFLHGSGERGDDNEAQLKWGVQHFASDEVMKSSKPIVIAPQCPQNMSWSNFSDEPLSLNDEPSEPMKLLIELISEMLANYPVDENRIYITGLSMGGFGTFDAITRYPDLFAAAVPVCGGGDISKAATFSQVPLWIFHGALDEAVDPAYSFKMVEALNDVGANPGLTIYPETGHFSWIAAYSDEMMMEWLFRQRKK